MHAKPRHFKFLYRLYCAAAAASLDNSLAVLHSVVILYPIWTLLSWGLYCKKEQVCLPLSVQLCPCFVARPDFVPRFDTRWSLKPLEVCPLHLRFIDGWPRKSPGLRHTLFCVHSIRPAEHQWSPGNAWKRDVSCSCATPEHKMQRLWFAVDRSTERGRKNANLLRRWTILRCLTKERF